MHFRHAKEKRDEKQLPYSGWKTTISIGIFLCTVSIVPLYNKTVFEGIGRDHGFPYPLMVTFLQLFFCAILLTIWSIVSQLVGDTTHSWILDQHLWFKLKTIFPIGFFFGLKFGITNLGLKMLPISTHLLLQSTDLMWTVIFAHVVNKEKLNMKEYICCLISVLGTLLISIRTHQLYSWAAFPVFINLLSPLLLGICVSSLRVATKRLLIDENHPIGKCYGMTSFELTGIKLWISSAVVLPFSLILENAPDTFTANEKHTRPLFEAMSDPDTVPLIILSLAGGILILVFQTNITFLAKQTSAVTVGIVGGLKIFPQWLFALVFKGHLDMNVMNISGAVLLLFSSACWTVIKISSVKQAFRHEHQYHRHRSYRSSHTSSETSIVSGLTAMVPNEKTSLI